MIDKELCMEMEAAGFRFKTFNVKHLHEISTDFEKLLTRGLIDEDFYNRNLTGFSYDSQKALDNAKSVIMIAAPQCKSIAEFNSGGAAFEVVVPPTYIYPKITDSIENILSRVIAKDGYSFARSTLPLKLLAVRSGLGIYGRNNVCYMPGFGSFIRLAAFVTDYGFEEDSWGDIKVMESCSTCTACVDKCPTGAIEENRFIINAQKCITNFNEYAEPIPEWISPQWHDSIVGCMKCQAACPHNRRLIETVEERISFDEEETGMILGGYDYNSLPAETRDKLAHMGMESYYSVLPRNIRLLMDK